VQRFDAFKVRHEGIRERGEDGRAVLAFQDPEGQRLELVDDGDWLQGYTVESESGSIVRPTQ
jgi:glyoxalase family protein